jgi:phosphoribosyl 1,2-cyclic phosphodiesterase
MRPQIRRHPGESDPAKSDQIGRQSHQTHCGGLETPIAALQFGKRAVEPVQTARRDDEVTGLCYGTHYTSAIGTAFFAAFRRGNWSCSRTMAQQRLLRFLKRQLDRMTSKASMSVRFWGVRGSIACSSESTRRYGGNTSCVEVRCGERTLIFDAGTGLRELGRTLATRPGIEIDILLSHCHLDHICGLPFFEPSYSSANRIRLWAGNLLPDFRLAEVVRQMMAPPLFPISYDVFKSELEFHDFKAGETLTPVDGIVVRTIRLNHPNGATGYRLEYAGRSVAYITDNEPQTDEIDADLVSFLTAVDVLIYDCTYTDDEYRAHVGWGHSTWQQGLKLATVVQAKTFCAFHHDPEHDDAMLDKIAAKLTALRRGALVAREGMVLQL